MNLANINTTYDNEGWRGIYDIDRSLVLELQDNRNNIARGFNGAVAVKPEEIKIEQKK